MTWILNPTRPLPVVPAKAGTSFHNVLGSCESRNDGAKALAFYDLFRAYLGSCLLRNDGVKALAFYDLYRVSLNK